MVVWNPHWKEELLVDERDASERTTLPERAGLKVIASEQKRCGKRQRVEEGKNGTEPRLLPPDLEAKRRELVVVTRGAVALIVGGRERSQNRVAIETALELQRLEWVSLEPNDRSLKQVLKKLPGVTIVWLTRFLHKDSRAVEHKARAQGSFLIHLSHGYGLHTVISETFDQMFRRSSANG